MNKIKRTFGFLLRHPLGKKHPVQTMLRFFVWQLQTLLSPSKLIVKYFIAPVKFYASKGLTGITGNIYSGLHEFEDMAFLLHFLRPEDIFFDIGANAGSFTLLASGICGATTIAVEPAQNTFSILSKNIALNKLQNKVSLINSIAGSSASTATFTQNEDAQNHVVSANESHSDAIELPVITIDSLLPKGAPALIKMDVEGYEAEVVKGLDKILQNPVLKAIIIELNGSGGRYGFDESKIHDRFIAEKFKPYKYNAFTRELQLQGTYGEYNTIYCREIELVSDRVKNAKAVEIMGEMI